MKLLLVVAYFIPEIGSAAHIYFDLAKALVRRGHEVNVITSYPREFNLNSGDKGKEFPLVEEIHGITIHRCKHPANRDNIIVRGLEHFYLPYYYFREYRSINKKFDACLMYIPPLPLYYLAKKIKRYDGTPSILNFQDFHPQELTDVGVLKNFFIIKVLEHIEREAYTKADHITVLSNGGIEYVSLKGAHKDKVTHIFNSITLSELDDVTDRKDFKEKEGIENKFVLSYAGILSPYQGIDKILDVAKKLIEHEDIIIYIAGDGSEKLRLNERVHQENIKNVKMLPLLPRSEYFNLINSSDVSFISLDERMNAPCLPGKTINLMVCNQPIIAMAAEDSEIANIVQKADCGIAVKPDDVMGILSAILCLKENASMREMMGRNGRIFLEKNMNLEKNIGHYEEIFSILTGHRNLAGRQGSSSSEVASEGEGL